MTVEVGLLVTLDAKPGKEDEVAAIPNAGLLVVEQEPGTVTWYAIRHGDTTFGIFDTFGTDNGRQAHLSGAVAKALGQVAGDLFASPPDIRPVDILAAKTAG
ncbi:putative quinol monooxygenase [Pseudonocardia acidicola]|uniref:Antibiotic biosynthesis monooxygenase n=1 Tax=Pseudonocardia acidicola TaxID=2724939 RepID=A0ABX1SN24_9PSEU|nr:antibiotic biosynthesis monooxygenase [Pseudonocardia acidicola]NMI01983.1 antibiotic biosynthesis monooxygenase [Pseudonocardia acidicola]